MTQVTDSLDLIGLELESGEARRLRLAVNIEPLELAGQSYTTESTPVEALVEVTKTASGWALRLQYETTLAGPCMRCLEDAGTRVAVDVREIDQPDTDEDLSSPYLADDSLDVAAWAHDSLALALPVQIFCTPQCKGLCAVCGANLNRAGPDHHHASERDERFAALDALRPYLR